MQPALRPVPVPGEKRKAEPHDPAHAPRHKAVGNELTLKPLVLIQCWPATDDQRTDDVGLLIPANMHGTTKSLVMKPPPDHRCKLDKSLPLLQQAQARLTPKFHQSRDARHAHEPLRLMPPPQSRVGGRWPSLEIASRDGRTRF
ncbi:hypothetical protein PtrSN002B_002578 [Pyrenophora tritici-repentis]|uniref:Uncharacterized protein n=2 Tax=Pyrenophora tritici-repentis TaxID=45151 RepID=A0A2W1ERV4_9PLEO|nr:uncharacterized protein PTRG_07589 [Pyrenophora tritici-repentis Pt-1C-BFP]KAA8617118.1 hypothetical protein PtrV1_10419 [Pyrenophora tritici-repentis]EDU50508.1 predicted protein [Pyrenophora tritici-repentis Pt-1C-BFP]KAF7446400.1 hypothetical protein A1F99_096910 [Pyrenophora tritici-repentis]KAF7567511.1 hypothetical protein PtrM4_141020 [Pyrenophora tritici-repentis]KAG9382099.1 hypothetical protein A1F94_007753 [Pyrenophora tritici-repentis]